MRRSHRSVGNGSSADSRVVGVEGLAKTERDKWNVPRVFGQERDCRLRRVHVYPFLKRILRCEQILIVEIDFIAAPAEVVAKVICNRAFGGDVGRYRSDGYVVAVHRSEWAVIARVAGVE